MAVPDRLRIPQDSRIGYMGRLADGTQFLAFVTGAFPVGFDDFAGNTWRRHKRWLAVLHRFDADGNHLATDTRLGGFDSEGQDVAVDKAWRALEQLLSDLKGGNELEPCDIWVRLFTVEIDGVVHGIIYEHRLGEEGEDSDYEGVLLVPPDIMFDPPWDSGEYST